MPLNPRLQPQRHFFCCCVRRVRGARNDPPDPPDPLNLRNPRPNFDPGCSGVMPRACMAEGIRPVLDRGRSPAFEICQVVLMSRVALNRRVGAPSAIREREDSVSQTHSPMDLRSILFGVVRPGQARGSDSSLGGRALSADVAFGKGWESLQREEFVEAERAFRLVLDARPDDADASLYLGMALAGQGRNAEAIAPLRAASEARPLDAEVHWRLGISLRETGELFLAMSAMREALQLRPGLCQVEAALDDLVSAAARSATRTSPVRARSLRRGARHRAPRYTRRMMPASSRELQVGA